MTFKEWITQNPFGAENQGKKELVVLVGPPAIGKSTYVARNYPRAFVVSRDDIVDQVAKEHGLTYDDLFKPIGDAANKEVNQKLAEAFTRAKDSGKDIVIDMTHMSSKARKSAISKIGGNYFKRAVVFTMQDTDLPELLRRMEDRSKKVKESGGSKTIGKDIVMRMIGNYQSVGSDEGFDKVEVVPFGGRG